MSTADPRSFYAERIPTQFNRALEEQAAKGDEGGKVLAGMRAVNATIRVDVDVEGGGTFFLNIREGRMSCADTPAHAPFLTLVQDRAAFEFLERESGDSAMALLGGLSGLAGEMKLTRQRIDNLAGVKGALLFRVTGDHGFSLLTHFGPDPVPEQPSCSIAVDPEAYDALRAGTLHPQDAFMTGRIQVEGDMQLAMQVALAALAPD
jgi:SCP-2 sterol transfer family